MDRLKISYRKYRKPGEEQKKDSYYMETCNRDSMREKFDLILMVMLLRKHEQKQFRRWFENTIKRR